MSFLLHVWQASNLALTRELERAERMLHAQVAINRDLHLELEEATRRVDSDRRTVGKKLTDLEALALQRLARTRELEVSFSTPTVDNSASGQG